jgi:energy-converting hydrogenase Eha subunit H
MKLHNSLTGTVEGFLPQGDVVSGFGTSAMILFTDDVINTKWY